MSVQTVQPFSSLHVHNTQLPTVLSKETNHTQRDLRCLTVAKEAIKAIAAALIGITVTMCLTSLAWATAVVVGGTAFTCALVIFGLVDYLEKIEIQKEKIQQFSGLLLDRVRACIIHNSQYKNKAEILALLDEVRNNSQYIQSGKDGIRVKFVGSQGAIEHVLACSQALNEVVGLMGAIHTPQPATPLCTRVNSDFAKNLLDPSIAHDLDKLLTVKSRAEVLREYLEKNGKLYIIYPQGGLEKRTAAEQEIYKEELQKYPDKLIDTVLGCQELDPDMAGATYLFKDREDNLYSFSIRKANDIQKQAEWGIWLGTVNNPVVKARVNAVFNYIKKNNGPDIGKEFPQLA